MTALTASPPTKWHECTAIWTLCISSGARARSPPPSPSPPWSSGRLKSPSLSTGCLRLVELCMTGERALAVGELVSFSVVFLMNEGKSVKLGEPQSVTISVHRCSGLPPPPCSVLISWAGFLGLSRKPTLDHVGLLLGQGHLWYFLMSQLAWSQELRRGWQTMVWQNWDSTCFLSRSAEQE